MSLNYHSIALLTTAGLVVHWRLTHWVREGVILEV